MPDGGFVSSTTAQADAALARIASSPDAAFALPLWRAWRAGAVVLGFMPRGSDDLDMKRMAASSVPVVLTIQDDDHASTGPAGFPVARKAFRWARSLMVHGTGGQPEHYAAAVALALRHGNLVLVETAAAHVEAWHDLARRAAMPRSLPGLVLVPHPGGTHPILPTGLH